jgi:hypothetical protein
MSLLYKHYYTRYCLYTEDVDLDVPDGFGAFIGYLSAKICRLLLVA